MSNVPFPVTLLRWEKDHGSHLVKRLPNTTFLDGYASLPSMSSIPSLSLGYSLIDSSYLFSRICTMQIGRVYRRKGAFLSDGGE